MTIVKTITTLNTVYKELQDLVIHQGSLLDRIDENIDSTHLNIEKANEHLTKVQWFDKIGRRTSKKSMRLSSYNGSYLLNSSLPASFNYTLIFLFINIQFIFDGYT